jgi:serine/threonine protein kinase
MAENDNDKTTTYGDSEKNKTEAYNSKQEETSAYSDSQNKEFKSGTHGIGVGDKLTLRSNEYVITTIISEGTGEAVIYKVEDKSKNAFALKLYFEFGNPKEEPNFETLKRIKDVTDPDILKLHDFGVGADKYQGRYCYEISDFAAGGDLFAVADFKAKYTKDFIEKSIVPEILHGIRKLHEFKIYHCDLKPSNIFFKDTKQTDLLIGDYGSAKAYDLETEKEVRRSSTVKGTDAYLSPEQARGIISEKNDYYSFGVILLHLLYPEQLSNDNNTRHIDKRKFEKIVERQYNSQQVVDFNPAYKRLNNLIEGLTLINHINRFGKNEVEKWMNGAEVEVKYKATETSSVQPVKLGYATIKTDRDFISVLETQPNWYDDLIEDQDTFSTVKGWMDSYRDIPSRKVFDSMIKFYQPLGKDYVKESLLRYFDPEREIKIDMNSFNFFTSNNIKKDVEAYILKLDDIWKITSIDKIRFYIFQLEFSLQQVKKSATKESAIVVGSLIDKTFSVFGLVQKSFDDFKTEIQTKVNPKAEAETFRLLTNLFYVFNPQRTFRDSKSNSLKTIDDLGLFYVQNEALFTDKYLKVEKEKFLEKLNKSELNKLDYKQFIFEIFKDKAEAQVELINLTFDKHRDYVVNYKFYKSLNTFLSQKKIANDFTSRSDNNEVYRNKRGFFQSFKSECENFISTVTEKHNITTLTDENLSQIRKKFSGDSWSRYFYIYSGQLLAFILLLPLAFFVYEIATLNLHFDKNMKPFFMDANAYQEKTQTDFAEEQKRIADDKASSFLSGINVQNIKLFASGSTTPAMGNRYYQNSFVGSQTQYIDFEVNISHNKPDTRTDFVIYFTIYKDNQKFAESSWNSYVLPEWSNSNHTGSWGDTKKTYWKKGNYRIDLRANNRSLGSQYFKITSKSYSSSNDDYNSTPQTQTTEVTEIPTEPVKQLKWISCSDCRGNGQIQSNGTCPTCNGAGQATCNQCKGQGHYECTNCKGEKKFTCSNCKGATYFVCSNCGGKTNFTCSNCNGSGYSGNGKCYTCNGTGKTWCYTCNKTGKTWCYTCNKAGYTWCYTCNKTGSLNCYTCNRTGNIRCNTCNGKGQVSGNISCPKCSGKGQVQVEI